MPLVIIAGNPCSGKSTIAKELQSLLEADGGAVHLVSENALLPDRNKCYTTLVEEKNTRAKIRTETDRNLTKSRTVILDSLNFVKGYRYELWCLARAAGTKCCVFWVDTPVEVCREWNTARPADQAQFYSPAVFEDLVSRFEPPNANTRWDSPLHIARPTSSPSPAEAVAAVVEGFRANSNAARGSAIADGPLATVSRNLTPNLATSQAPRAGATALHKVDRAAQAVVQRISDAQSSAPAGMGPGVVEVVAGHDIELQTPVAAAELRRLKRAFVKAATGGTCMGGTASTLEGDDVVARAFLGFLRDHLTGAVLQEGREASERVEEAATQQLTRDAHFVATTTNDERQAEDCFPTAFLLFVTSREVACVSVLEVFTEYHALQEF